MAGRGGFNGFRCHVGIGPPVVAGPRDSRAGWISCIHRRGSKMPPIPHPIVRFRSRFPKNLEALTARLTFPQGQGRIATVPSGLIPRRAPGAERLRTSRHVWLALGRGARQELRVRPAAATRAGGRQVRRRKITYVEDRGFSPALAGLNRRIELIWGLTADSATRIS
jgi:hypothetical protein